VEKYVRYEGAKNDLFFDNVATQCCKGTKGIYKERFGALQNGSIVVQQQHPPMIRQRSMEFSG
tara:strand:+ start:2551 stop:2739 length:189 start_codon:yes stop_codon:yes gene_type:complete